MLSNPGFEDILPTGLPESWELAGNPEISTDGSQSHSGRTALLITGPSVNGAFQNAAVDQNSFYTVSYWARPEDGNQIIQLYVLWLDINKEILGQSAEWVKLKRGWRNYRTIFSPVSGTYFAGFVVTTASPGTTWVDDVCLTTYGACP